MMKTLIVYSSITGNTEKVAKAIKEIMPADCVISPLKGAPDPEGFDFIALGFWVTRGGPDKLMQRYMSRVKGKKVGFFATLAAWPDSPHALKVKTRAHELLSKDNTILCSFLCQGKLNQKLRRESEETLVISTPLLAHPKVEDIEDIESSLDKNTIGASTMGTKSKVYAKHCKLINTNEEKDFTVHQSHEHHDHDHHGHKHPHHHEHRDHDHHGHKHPHHHEHHDHDHHGHKHPHHHEHHDHGHQKGLYTLCPVGNLTALGDEGLQHEVLSKKNEGHKKRHPMTPERRARLIEAEKHPDGADLQQAKVCFAKAFKEIEN